jgi:hypothetical protein
MKIVGYTQPQTVAAQKTEKPAADGKSGGSKPQGNKTNGGNKPAADGKK